MRVTVQNLYTSFREEEKRVEFGCTVGLNLMAQRARYFVPSLSDGTVDARQFTKALRDVADAFDKAFDQMEGVENKPKSGLILPGTLKE